MKFLTPGSIMDRFAEAGTRRRVIEQLTANDQTLTTTIANAFIKIEALDSNATFNAELRLALAVNNRVSLSVQLAGWNSVIMLGQYSSLVRCLEAIQQFNEFIVTLDYVHDGVFSPVNFYKADSVVRNRIQQQLQFIKNEIVHEFERFYNREVYQWN